MATFPLKFNLSPSNLRIDSSFGFTELESDRSCYNEFSQELYEIKTQLEIVNEDRDRLKSEVKELKNERIYHFNRLVNDNMTKTPIKSYYKDALVSEIGNLRKECEENDKILNTLKEILGQNEFEGVLKENYGKGMSPIQNNRVNRSTSKLPGPSRIGQQNRSVSPYQKLFHANSNL
jgi:predicted RNase H-like nuclease (RuvC/YqgF family)